VLKCLALIPDRSQFGSRTSLQTKDRAEAERLVLHKNEALRHPLLNRKIGMAYLAGTDSARHGCTFGRLDLGQSTSEAAGPLVLVPALSIFRG
jgi:hypothetical protein